MTDETPETPNQRRGDDRRTAFKSGRIIYNNGKSDIGCRIRNISEGGAKLELGTAQLLPHTFELQIPGMPTRQCSSR